MIRNEQGNKRRKNTSSKKTNSKNKERKNIEFNIKWDKKKITIIVILVFAILSIIAVNNYASLGLVINKNITSEDAVQVELQTSNNTIIPFGSEVLVYNKGSITSYNNYGKNTGKIVLEDTVEADIVTSGKYIQATNKDKGIVYVYKNKYEVARIKIDGKIYSANINSDGISVIEYSSNGSKTALGIYDSAGDMLYNVKLSNNIIGKYVLSDNSEYLAYVEVNIAGISVKTDINIIDLEDIKEDTTNIQTVYSKDNSLAYDLYWSGNTVIASFDDCYMTHNASSGKNKIIQISEGQISNVDSYEKRYAYTELSENGSYMIGIKKMTSDSLKTISIDEMPKYFKYQNGIIYACFSKQIQAYNSLGMKIKNYNSDMVITEPIVFNNGRSIAMAISNKLIMFTI